MYYDPRTGARYKDSGVGSYTNVKTITECLKDATAPSGSTSMREKSTIRAASPAPGRRPSRGRWCARPVSRHDRPLPLLGAGAANTRHGPRQWHGEAIYGYGWGHNQRKS